MKYLSTASWVGLFALGMTLRLVWLGEVPSPAGDERNAGMLGLRLSQGLPAQLSAEEAFIPRTFGHLIAGMFWVFGQSFWAARLVSALIPMVSMIAVFLLCQRSGLKAMGWVMAVLFLFLPWPVMWGRSIACPYALNLPLSILGTLGWLLALDILNKWRQTAALVIAGQILAFGMHFSPLAIIPLLTCCLWTIVARFASLKRLGPWVSLVFIALHLMPLLLTLWQATGATAQLLKRTQEMLERSGDPYVTFPQKLERYALVMIDVWAGESTVRYFSNVAYEGLVLWTCRGAVFLAMLAACMAGLAQCTKATLGCPDTPIARSRQLACFAAFYLLLGLVLLPVILSFGRIWSLWTNFDERYGFVTLAPSFLLLGALATYLPKVRWCLAVAVLLLGVLPTSRILWSLTQGGGPSYGLFNFDGGGWFGFRVLRGPQDFPTFIWRILEREAKHEPIVFVGGDKFSMDAIDVLIEGSERGDIRYEWVGQDSSGRLFWPPLPPGRRILLAAWSDAMFAPGFRPSFLPLLNQTIRQSFQESFEEVELLQTMTQPDGSPLMELWIGRMPRTK